MKCPKCGTEFDKAKFCPECGAPAPAERTPESSPTPSPIKPKKKLKKWQIILIAVGGVIVLSGVLQAAGIIKPRESASSSTPTASLSVASEPTSSAPAAPTAQELYIQNGMTVVQAEVIDAVISRQVGMAGNAFASMVPNQIIQGAHEEGDAYDYYITLDSKQTYSVKFEGDAIKTIEDKNGLFLYQDSVENPHYFNFDALDFSTVRNIAQEHISSILKSPSTAEYPGSLLSPNEGWSFNVVDNQYLGVQSYVDSQNSFGAMPRAEFTIYYQLTTTFEGDKFQTSYTAVYVVFDGEIALDNR